MGILGHSHALRVVIIAWGMAWFGPAADLTAGTLDSTGASEQTGAVFCKEMQEKDNTSIGV